MSRSVASRIACCALVMATGPARADDLSEREFLTDFPTVLSASRLRQNAAQTPQAVTVIDQDTIRTSGVREIAELFRLVPGFNVSYANVNGLQPIVTYHGLGREFFSRLQVLIDGRSMNNATLGGVDWSDLPLALDDIERIEVVRGPSAATQGVGAFLGTINFVTKHPAQQRGAYASVIAGGDGILDAVARYAGGGQAFDLRITAAHQSDDGFRGIADQRRLDFATMRGDWQLGPVDSVMLQAGATSRNSDAGAGSTFDPARNERSDTGYVQVRWERNVDADNGFSAQIYYYCFNFGDRFVTDPIPQFRGLRVHVDNGSTVSRADIELQHTFSIGSTSRWVWGASAREDVAEATSILRGDQHLHLSRLFGHVEWQMTTRALLNVGAMVEHNNLAGTHVEPQIAVAYTIVPGHVVRLGISRASRNPTLFEESVGSIIVGPGGVPVVVPGSIRPESIASTEFDYLGDLPALHASVDVKLFHDRLSDLIALVNDSTAFPPSTFPRTIVNGDGARQRGAEAQLIWRPLPAASLILSVAHVETASTDRFAAYSTSVPRNTLHALWTQRFPGSWDSAITWHQQSGYRPLGMTSTQPGFGRLDLRLARQMRAGPTSVEIAGVVENALDRQYTEFSSANVARRRAWLSVNLSY